MIESISAKNYKSFDFVDVDVKNINVFLGSNSCGKSSIINLLLMMSQTAESYTTYDSILKLNGGKSSLGESINIFPNKNENEVIEIGFSLTSKSITSHVRRYSIFELIQELEHYTRRGNYIKRKESGEWARKGYIEIAKLLDKMYEVHSKMDGDRLRRNELNSVKSIVSKVISPVNRYLKLDKKLSDKYDVSQVSTKRASEFIEFAFGAGLIETTPKKVVYKIGYNSTRLECELKGVSIFNAKGKVIYGISISKSNKIDLESDIIDKSVLDRSRLDIIRGINLKDITLFNDDFTINCPNPFAQFIRDQISAILTMFASYLSETNINHVTPLRAFPQRYYLLEKSAHHTTLSSDDGSQLAEILKNNKQILDKINVLLKDFDIKVSTSKTNDIIHRITVKQGPVTLELTDVGFGISQVLPILVQAYLSPEESITIIEQPEIHLHPKMQAWLASALVFISMKENKKFIIETHSETIVKRLQILMLDEEVDFSLDHLNIYHFERVRGGKTTIKNVPFTEYGDIEWPQDFMDMEISDAIKLQELKVKRIMKVRGEQSV
ncbi:hypothetical protein N480_21200 [Pseudoalteromonas luteoviolacea S2607]|uniref:AAA family ATPase n=1 Tax=Pseudoalteromonas luteoviolacea TaxID=43657 RepID=UPI0007B08BD4|nr:AAA family ATPase [Pseudoalteromonas luteoviolacea]KZN34544.1 hypothetical protein N480_21200 [Pseudoalteromonas luteoviolacea S2607]